MHSALCSIARNIAEYFEINSVVTISHDWSGEVDKDWKRISKALSGFAANPNSYAVIFLTLGNETEAKLINLALKIGIEATASNTSALTMTATVDNENRSSPPYTLSSTIVWQNNQLQTIGWANNSGATIGWGTTGYALYKTDAQQYGKYLGITVTSSNPDFVYNGYEFEHELRVRF